MNYYDLTIWEEFQSKELNKLFNKTLNKNGMKVNRAKRDQILEDCKSYLAEEFFKISKMNTRKQLGLRYREYITGALRKQVIYYFAREKHEYKRKMKREEHLRELPKEKQEMIHIDKTITDWSEFDFTELSKKELQIVCFIYLGGKSDQWIAQKLNITINNVYQIRFRILDKLKSKNNEELFLSLT